MVQHQLKVHQEFKSFVTLGDKYITILSIIDSILSYENYRVYKKNATRES